MATSGAGGLFNCSCWNVAGACQVASWFRAGNPFIRLPFPFMCLAACTGELPFPFHAFPFYLISPHHLFLRFSILCWDVSNISWPFVPAWALRTRANHTICWQCWWAQRRVVEKRQRYQQISARSTREKASMATLRFSKLDSRAAIQSANADEQIHQRRQVSYVIKTVGRRSRPGIMFDALFVLQSENYPIHNFGCEQKCEDCSHMWA